MTITEIRIKNLKNIISSKFGSVNAFAKAVEKHSSQFYNLFKGEREFGQNLARDLEIKLGLKAGELDLDKSQEIKPESTSVIVPEYDIRLSAGLGNSIFSEDVLRWRSLDAEIVHEKGWNKERLCVFKVDGDSMLDVLLSGERVVVDTSRDSPTDNRIFAVRKGDKVLIKRILIDPVKGQVNITSINPEYSRFDFVANEDVKIIGLAVHTLGREI